MTQTTSKSKVFIARLAVALLVAFVLLGAFLDGLSGEVFARMWQNLLDRPTGPMAFRFLLQPTMAIIAAILDGWRDAKAGRSPYLWALLFRPGERAQRLSEGVISTARIILLGLGMDLIYQFIELKTFFPGEAAVIAVLLAFVPYLLLRGPAERVAHWWLGDQVAKGVR